MTEEEKKNQELKKYAFFIEPWNDIYGYKYSDIPYDINGKIKNTFKKGEINYNEDLGEVNDGNDYDKNENNIYELYVPYSSTLKKMNFKESFYFSMV